MNAGKTLFAQVMEFVPWKTFGRIVERHNCDASVRTRGCADLFRIMAFSQLTWRESLRDIEARLEANQAKLFHIGIAAPPARSTLADALNLRDWRIYHALALRLIARARTLYAEDSSVLGLDASVYALDSTPIDLCLSLFDWAPFRSTKAAIKLHTLLDLRAEIPAFIHISDGKMHDVKWIKQHRRIKRFLATSENAVRSQIWCAVATYVLIAIVKKELKLDTSLYLKSCRQRSEFSAAEDRVFASPFKLGRLPYSYTGTRQQQERA